MILRLSLLPMLLTPLVCTAEGLQPGTQALYRGSIAPLAKDRSPQEPQKTFDLVLLVADAAEGHRLYWTLEERGRGAWPWAERFGSVAVDRLGRKVEQSGPTLLYDLGEAKSSVVITLPLLAAEQPLSAALEWEEGTLKHV